MFPTNPNPSLFPMIEPHDHNAQIVRRVIGHGVIEKLLARILRIVDRSNEIDRVLISGHVPQLGILQLRNGNEKLDLLRHMRLSGTRPGRLVSFRWYRVIRQRTPSCSHPREILSQREHLDVSYLIELSSPLTRLFMTKPPASVILFASCESLPL